MAETYTISDLVREFGVTARTLRHYEDEGLLTPGRKSGARVFSNRDRARLKLALRGKRLGFTLQQIRELFALYDSAGDEAAQLEQFLIKLDKHRSDLEAQRADVEIMLNEINFFATQCRRRLAALNKASPKGVG